MKVWTEITACNDFVVYTSLNIYSILDYKISEKAEIPITFEPKCLGS